MVVSQERKALSYKEVENILSHYELPLARAGVSSSVKEAAEIAGRIGYPVALKVLSPQISHKTDAGAIKLNIASEVELADCYNRLMKNARDSNSQADIEGILVQEMLPNDVEIIVGLSRDAQFGPVMLFGLGGVFTELLNDIALRVPPVGRFDVVNMIHEIKGYKLLEGFRGKPKRDFEAIVDILLKVSKIAVDMRHSILEMDLNPVVVQPEGKGAQVVDVRLIVSGLPP